MFKKDLQNCKEFIAGDNVILRELLHPENDNISVRYSLAHGIVKPGEASKQHKLKSSEVYYIIEGEGLVYVDHKSAHVNAGSSIYIPPDSVQYIKNTGSTDLKFLCIVDPPWQKEDEEVL